MVNQDLLNAFNDCVDRLTQGQSVDDCLRFYPQYADVLRPMLEAGSLVRRLHVPPSEVTQAQARVRLRFEQAVQAKPLPRYNPYRGLLSLAAALLLVFLVVAGGTSALAQTSLPGDPLYSLKRLTESVRLSLNRDDAALQAELAARRVDEIRQLLALRRAQAVTFSGLLSNTDGENWQVAGLTMQVAPSTPGADTAQIGDVIEVQARTTVEGTLIASQIQVIQSGERPHATVEPLVPTPTGTATSSHTPSPTPTLTATPSPTLTPSATRTRVPTATTGVASPAACVPAAPAGWVTYRVQSGDTLSGLAANRGVTLEQVMAANCLTNARIIVVGQTLFLPPAPAPTSAAPASDVTQGGSGGNDNSGSDDNSGGNSGSGGSDDSDNDDNGNDNSSDDNGNDDD